MAETNPIHTPQGKIEFLNDLVSSVLKSIIDTVPRMPKYWDGHELRQLLADKFSNETTDMTRSRTRDYENDRIVNNI